MIRNGGYNINDIENIINLARFEQCRHVHIIFLMPAGNTLNRGYNNLNPNDDQIDNLMQLLKKLKSEFKGVISIDWGNSSHTPPYPEFTTEGFSVIDKLFAGCPAGKTKILIDAFGNVYSCDILRTKDMCAGNIKNQSFEEIWAESNVLKTFRSRTPDKIKGKCLKCEYLNACVGGCPAYSVIDGHDIFYGDTSCTRNNFL